MLLHLSIARFSKSSISLLSFKPQFRSIFANSSHIWTAAPSNFVCCSSLGSDHNSLATSVGSDNKNVDSLEVLQGKVEALGIKCEVLRPGFYDLLMCPKCHGGKLMQRTLSFHVSKMRDFSMWRCFHVDCGWAEQVFVDQRNRRLNWASNFSSSKAGSLDLEPLGEKLLAYFADRMISKGTLQRNGVMQVCGDQSSIAFCYRQNGVLVGCKYRRMDKKFWQEKGTHRIFYGIDDVQGASEVIIVEGEMDKLSMEEAGFQNCVSVPGGAPNKVSNKELPPVEKDAAYQYIWNCKGYLEKASRIILATDADPPGQALAIELARRLGRKRCWRVLWPEREGSERFVDANEVLMKLGSDAVRKAIESAVLFEDPELEPTDVA